MAKLAAVILQNSVYGLRDIDVCRVLYMAVGKGIRTKKDILDPAFEFDNAEIWKETCRLLRKVNGTTYVFYCMF